MPLNDLDQWFSTYAPRSTGAPRRRVVCSAKHRRGAHDEREALLKKMLKT